MKKLILSLLICSFISVSAQKRKDDSAIIPSIAISYSLPKVTYKVIVKAECKTNINAPYAPQASSKLGLNSNVNMTKENWRVMDIEFEPCYFPDENATFTVNTTNDYSQINLNLNPQGLLCGVASYNQDTPCYQDNYSYSFPNNKQEDLDIRNIKGYNTLKERLDTNYSILEVDGEIKKIWDPIVKTVVKDENEKLEDAVNELHRIRTLYADLITSDTDLADGETLAVLLKELKEQEAEYLKLFVGTQIIDTIQQVFYYTPQKANSNELIFRFSEEYGFSEITELNAMTFSAKVTSINIPSQDNKKDKNFNNQINYRIPANAEVQLFKGKTQYCSFLTTIPQLGIINGIPFEIIKNQELSIDLHPLFGSLKSIKSNKKKRE